MDYTLISDEEIDFLKQLSKILRSEEAESKNIELIFKKFHDLYGEEKFNKFQSDIKGYEIGIPWYIKKEKWDLTYCKFCRLDADQIDFIIEQRKRAFKNNRKVMWISAVVSAIVGAFVNFIMDFPFEALKNFLCK